jgi:hypothetical protein
MCSQVCIEKGFLLMNRNRYIGAIIFTILVIFGPHYFANGQGKARTKIRPKPASPAPTPSSSAAKVPVIVNFKDGNHVDGLFLGADTETVQVLVRSKKTSIKMSDVFSIVFEAEEEETPAKSIEETVKNLDSDGADPTLPLARKAYNSLRRLAEAIEVRVPYSQYSAQLFEAKAVVDEATGVLPDGAVKIDLKHALEVFTDAARAWGAVQQQFGPRAGRIPINTEPGSSLMQKYKIKPELNAVAQADHLKLDTALKTISAAAEQILRNIDLVLGQ